VLDREDKNNKIICQYNKTQSLEGTKITKSKIHLLLWNPKVHYRLHNTVLSQAMCNIS